METLEIDDLHFSPCTCGYQVSFFYMIIPYSFCLPKIKNRNSAELPRKKQLLYPHAPCNAGVGPGGILLLTLFCMTDVTDVTKNRNFAGIFCSFLTGCFEVITIFVCFYMSQSVSNRHCFWSIWWRYLWPCSSNSSNNLFKMGIQFSIKMY